MTDKLTQSLLRSRHYCTDRLIEVKEEIARLQNEGLVLKARIETAADETAVGQIRRRRRFLGRRIDELKAERTALTTELETATVQWNIAIGKTSQDGHAPAPELPGPASIASERETQLSQASEEHA